MRAKIRVELAWVALAVISATPFVSAKAAPSSDGQTPAAHGLASLPASMQPGISGTLGREDSRYRVTPVEGGFHASNPVQRISAEFTPAAANITQGATNWKMSLAAYGYGEKLNQADAASIEARDNRVDYHRGAMNEWYVNGPLGMEQGFTLQNRPGTSSGAPLTLQIALSGNVDARVDARKNSLVLARAGAPVLQYSGLTAYDAKGSTMKTWMEVQGTNLLLHVDDRTAQYPLTVDPYVQTVILSPSDGGANDEFGYSVAYNDDYAVVGSPAHSLYQGAVYVFAAPTATTTGYTAELTASNGVPGDNLGYSVAIGADDTIVAGAPYVNGYQGAVYTFAKPSGGFATTSAYTAELTNDYNGAAFDALGFSVSISAHVITAGAPGANNYRGYVLSYVYPAITSGYYWNQFFSQTDADGDYFGWAVASYETDSLAGAPQSNNYVGTAYLFEPKAGGYNTFKFTTSNGASGDQFGLSISADGTGNHPSVIAVGSPFRSNVQGAVYIYQAPTKGWATTSASNAEITSSDSVPYDAFGYSVAISKGVLAVGAPGRNNYTGEAYAYLQPTGGWATTSTPYEESGPNPVTEQSQEYFGWSVGLAPNGDAVVGAPYVNPLGVYANAPAGLAYVFNSSGPAPTVKKPVTVKTTTAKIGK